MQYTTTYNSPLGQILIACDDIGLTGLWFIGQKYFASNLPATPTQYETQILSQTKNWLDTYFRGTRPDFIPPLNPSGTQFQKSI